jgi:hypothetical protein
MFIPGLDYLEVFGLILVRSLQVSSRSWDMSPVRDKYIHFLDADFALSNIGVSSRTIAICHVM